jgi:hypothetical protein
MLLQPFFSSHQTISSATSSLSISSLASLSPSPSTPYYSATNIKLPSLIVALLQKRVIPEAEALSSKGHKDDNAILGARMGIVRVVLSVLCLCLDSSEQRDDIFSGFSPRATHGIADIKLLVKWAVGLLCQWYKAKDKLPWKAVMERTLPQVVS